MGWKRDNFSEDDWAALREEMETLGAWSSELEDLGNEVEKRSLQPRSIDENGSYVKVKDKGMSAWLYLASPDRGRQHYTEDEVLEFLKANEVTSGYLKDTIELLVRDADYEREIQVAAGKPAVEGTDGFYEYLFSPNEHKAPKILENGNVDYTSMSAIQNIKKGEQVAIYHPAVPGQEGYNVRGEVLQPRRIRDMPPLKGFVDVSQEDPNIYLAARDGKIQLKAGRIDIQTHHEIKGDVTLIIGKVEFFGDITITGNVEAGVVIRAGRNIVIQGTVEGANLYAGGDIVLKRGIQGAQKAKISARGNIFADFIEHTIVMAGDTVQANTIINSRVTAGNQVIATGKKGVIMGGYIHAKQGIRTTEIGNSAEVRTVIHAGCEKEVYEKLAHLRLRKKEMDDRLQAAAAEAEDVAKRKAALQGGYVPKMLESRMQSLQQTVKEVRDELRDISEQQERLKDSIEQGADAQIMVSGTVYRGTVVGISELQIPIEQEVDHVRYHLQQGMIECSGYRGL